MSPSSNIYQLHQEPFKRHCPLFIQRPLFTFTQHLPQCLNSHSGWLLKYQIDTNNATKSSSQGSHSPHNSCNNYHMTVHTNLPRCPCLKLIHTRFQTLKHWFQAFWKVWLCAHWTCVRALARSKKFRGLIKSRNVKVCSGSQTVRSYSQAVAVQISCSSHICVCVLSTSTCICVLNICIAGELSRPLARAHVRIVVLYPR